MTALKLIDVAPEPREKPLVPQRCEVGDLWQMGPHRLLVGDCLDPANIRGLMKGRTADLVFTDPPYHQPSMNKQGANSAFIRPGMAAIEEAGLNVFDPQIFLDLLPVYYGAGPRMGERPALRQFSVFVWCNDQLTMEYKRWAKEHGGYYVSHIWQKPNPAPKGGGPHPAEFLLWLRKNALWNDKGENDCPVTVPRSRILNFPLQGSDRTGHPCPKPVQLIQNELYLTTKPGDIVVDPFAGRGSTLRACIQSRRVFYGMEHDAGHAGWMLALFEGLTGQKAVRL